MEEDVSAWCVGVLVAALGLAGVVLAAGARDDGMYVFAWSLIAFAGAFVFSLMRMTYARKDREHE